MRYLYKAVGDCTPRGRRRRLRPTVVCGGSFNASIFGGCHNVVSGSFSMIGDGQNNIVGSGTSITYTADYSYIGGGFENNIGSAGVDATADYAYIGGGYQNCMDTTAGGGTQFNVIGGGFQNKVCVDAFFSSIFSGEQNRVQGQYSAILGGSGNYDNGFNYVGIFGQGITGVTANTFHTNCLNLFSLYRGTTPPPYPFGSVWVDTTGGANILKII